MSTGILLMTHPGIGSSILHNAMRIYGETPLPVRCLEVPVDTGLARIEADAIQAIEQLDEGYGVLVITDIFGATPDNIARKLNKQHKIIVLAGLNLPMLLRVFNYPLDDLTQLCAKAVEGGTRGVFKGVPESE